MVIGGNRGIDEHIRKGREVTLAGDEQREWPSGYAYEGIRKGAVVMYCGLRLCAGRDVEI